MDFKKYGLGFVLMFLNQSENLRLSLIRNFCLEIVSLSILILNWVGINILLKQNILFRLEVLIKDVTSWCLTIMRKLFLTELSNHYK